MSDLAALDKGLRTKEPNWIMTGRILLVIGTGEIAASVVPSHTDWAYFGGLLLGLILELLIFPRLGWKRNLVVLLIVLIAGSLRVALKSASP
jgi:uncharacterized membrane protein YdcZ (DUF606 family)